MDKYLKSILWAITIVVFAGCVAPHRPSALVSKVQYTPELNTVSTAEIGQNMFEKVYASYTEKGTCKLLDTGAEEKYQNGEKTFKRTGSTCTMLYNGEIRLIDYGCKGMFTHEVDGFTVLDYGEKKLATQIKYEQKTHKSIITSEDSFKYTVLYQGKVGNKLNIKFQEFVHSDNTGDFIIRDAYTQNIQYELDSNGEALIGFRGLRIKVLKATNFNITYKVIHDYD